MALQQIENLRAEWFAPARGMGAAVERALDQIGFTQSYVQSCALGRATRVIKDGVWGMINLDPSTALLLDSPPVQRLRWIRQLGFSYLVYPSADHSRFSHSLGVYHVVRRFVETMRDTPELQLESGVKLMRPSTRDELDLAHAAILHDVGHMPFSHVTENVVRAAKSLFTCGPWSVDDFTFAPEETLRKSLATAECLSLLIVLSKRFVHFYDKVVRNNDTGAAARVACLIAGLRPTQANRALPDMISSGLDADKIDYLCRDSAACQIPLGIDVARIFVRSAFLEVPYRKVPEELHSNEDPIDEPLTIFVVNASGMDTVEEIISARAAMYRRVYLHKTTRNAERLLAKAMMHGITDANGLAEASDLLTLWAHDDSWLLRTLASASSSPQCSHLARRISIRDLPKRAGVFGAQFLELLTPFQAVLPEIDSVERKKIKKQVIGSVIEGLKDKELVGEKQTRFEESLRVEALRIRDALVSQDPDGSYPSESLDLVSTIPIPSLGYSKVSECFVLESDGHLESSRMYSNSSELADAADLHVGFGHIFADPPWREIVFLASRNVLYSMGKVEGTRRIGIAIGNTDKRQVELQCVSRPVLDLQRSARRAKLSLPTIDRLLKKLELARHFDIAPRLAPFRRDHGVRMLAGQFSQFNGQHGWRVTEESITLFIEQFPPRLREDMFDLLGKMPLLDRREIAATQRRILERIQSTTTGRRFVVALTPSSGAQVRMLLEQEEHSYLQGNWTVCSSLEESLGHAKADDTIAFCDDNTSSGSQASCQFRAWMGVPRTDWPSALRREKAIFDVALNDPQRALLKTINIEVAVSVGSETAKATLREVFAELGLRSATGLNYAHAIDAHTSSLRPDLAGFLSHVGAAVLKHCRWDVENLGAPMPEEVAKGCERDALGYGGLGGLMATLFNVPSSVITAIWCPGMVDGEPWLPLFLRRGYFDNLIVS